MIKPTVGRQVWFWTNAPLYPHEQPEAATVAYVWNDRMVNLQVINRDGIARSETSVRLHQEGDAMYDGPHCEWMPFQKGQAKAQEAASSS